MKVKLVWIFAGIAALICLVLYVFGWLIALDAPLSLENEGICLWATISLAHGFSIYDPSNLSSAPWRAVIYPPLYFLVCVPFQVLAGTSYWGLRLVSMISWVISLVSSYRIFHRTTNSYLITAVALVTYSSFLPVWSCSFKGRVDMLAVTLSIVALDLFLVAYSKREQAISDDKKTSTKVLHLSGLYSLFIICSVLAIFTKQSALVVPLSVAVFLLSKNKYLDYLVISVGSAALSIAGLYGLDVWTNGGFIQHMNLITKIPVSGSDLNNHLILIAVDLPKLLLVPVGIFFLGRRKQDTLDATLPIALLLIGGIVTFYSLSTPYGSINNAMYFYWSATWLLAICLAVAPKKLAIIVLCSSLSSVYILSRTVPELSSVVSKMPASMRLLKRENFKDTTMFVEDPVLAIEVGAEPLFIDVATILKVWKKDAKAIEKINTAIVESQYSAVIINRHDSQFETPPYFWPPKLVRLVRKHYTYQGTVVANGEVQDIFLKKSKPEKPEPEEDTDAPVNSTETIDTPEKTKEESNQ